MTNRTIYVIGQGFNPTPVSIVATLDGNVVKNGTIPTVDQDISVSQSASNTELQDQMLQSKTALFSFEKDVDFAGTASVSIEVTGGPVWFGAVISNYVADKHPNPVLTAEQQAIVSNPASTVAELQQIQIDIANPPFTAEEIAVLQTYTTFPYPPEGVAMLVEHNAKLTFASSGATGFEKLPDFDGTADDTWSSVSINGIPVTTDPFAYDPARIGTWWWTLYPGDVFTGTLQIPKGVQLP